MLSIHCGERSVRRVLSAFRRAAASPRIVVCFGVAYAVSQILIARILHPLDPRDVLRVQTTLGAPVVRDILAHWRADGLIDAWVRHFSLDFAHPALYAMFLGASLAWLLDRNRLSSAWDVVLVLPIAAALCDLAENASHVAFLVDDANVTTAWVAVSGAAAIAKWLLAGSSIVLIVILALRTRLVAGRAVA